MKFKVGDLVEITYVGRPPAHAQWNGYVGVILQPAREDFDDSIPRWEISGAVHKSGVPFAVKEKYLRKKKPPKEDEEKIDWVKLCNLKKMPEVV